MVIFKRKGLSMHGEQMGDFLLEGARASAPVRAGMWECRQCRNVARGSV